MAVSVCARTSLFPMEGALSSIGRCTLQSGLPIRAKASFPTSAGVGQKAGRGAALHICFAEIEGNSCCGGSGSGNGGSKCSSHGSSKLDVAGIGKEFEALVAQKTMQEFEKDYQTGQMEGTISRDVLSDVVNIFPDAVTTTSEEKFLDIDELLAEARSLSASGDDFVFDDFHEMLV